MGRKKLEIWQKMWWESLTVERRGTDEADQPRLLGGEPDEIDQGVHWFFNRENQRVKENGKPRRINGILYDEWIKSDYDHYKIAPLSDCGISDCVNPYHAKLYPIAEAGRRYWKQQSIEAQVNNAERDAVRATREAVRNEKMPYTMYPMDEKGVRTSGQAAMESYSLWAANEWLGIVWDGNPDHEPDWNHDKYPMGDARSTWFKLSLMDLLRELPDLADVRRELDLGGFPPLWKDGLEIGQAHIDELRAMRS